VVQVEVRLLLDSHALVWWLLGDNALPAHARAAIADTGAEVFISAVTAWELSIKFALGKLPTARALVADFDAIVAREGFRELMITVMHGRNAGVLPMFHKDPFDRMLIAQAMAERLVLVSNEVIFDAYGVARLW
jgi:PIN domain nuclease of toxin-antitoxin system